MPDLRMPEKNSYECAARLTRDPELREIGSGQKVCKIGLCVSKRFKPKSSSEYQEERLFINATFWNQPAKWCAENLKKGSPVYVEGSLKMNEWTDKESGQKRSTIEIAGFKIQSLEWADKSGGGGYTDTPNQGSNEPVPEDDIPY